MREVLRNYVRYPLEALGAIVLYGVFAVLPVDTASSLGGLIGRAIGPFLPVSRRAHANIARAMPEVDAAVRGRIVRGMWDNLGRVAAEYPHIERIARNAGHGGRVEVVGAENVASVMPDGVPAILISGHLANWEVFTLSAEAFGLHYAHVYRPPNNPLVGRLVHGLRRLPPEQQIPKGTAGARMAIGILRRGGKIGMLVDQKMNDGIAVPFFGRPAMSPPAVAQLGLKFGCAMIPARLERLDGCRFRLTFMPPMALERSGDRRGDVSAMMARVNGLLEGWIRERPEQWLWLHRRWPE